MTQFKYFLQVFICLCFAFLFQSFKSKEFKENISPTDTLRIESGVLSGLKNETNKVSIYKGIPFAAPPVGDLRWKAPQPVKAWTGIKKCENYGPSPYQNAPAPFSMWSAEFLIPKEPISEDCLYLNVWTAARTAKAKRPVLVWIYGGGFNSGGGNVPIYDGEALASKGLVVVSINYRVGVFGFLAHPELTKEASHHSSGNYGLMDQIAALKWVQKNIAAFGGDPGNVTIAGQSAGSMSVNCLVASPLAKGLFKKAIAQSGGQVVQNPLRDSNTLQQAEQKGVELAKTFNANSIADLRKLSPEKLQEKTQGMHRPIVDGYVLPQSLPAIFAANKQNDVVLLTGWNENEGILFGPEKTAAEFKTFAEEQYGKHASILLQYYPSTTDAEAAISQRNLSRDLIFGVQNYTWANIQSGAGKKVYVYRFTRKVPATGEYVKYGAFHTGEVPYVFNNLKFVDRPWEVSDRKMANILSSYWVNFAYYGNPNGRDLPKWPEYNHSTKQIMKLDTECKSIVLPDQAPLDFLYSVMSGKRQ
jgi:para-nitrobenzyl esterase